MFKRRQAYTYQISWSVEDERKLLSFLKASTFNSLKLEKLFPNRTMAAIKSKTRKLRIKYDLFGESYRDSKIAFTAKHSSKIKPVNVFEAYSGAGHQSKVWLKTCKQLFACDRGATKKKQFEKAVEDLGFKRKKSSSAWSNYFGSKKNIYFYHGDVIDAAVDIRQNGVKIDVLDLDTCGSTLPILPTLLNLIKPKYLFITHGEFHSKRFGRDDVLRRVLFHRDVNDSCLNLTVDELSIELDKAVKIAALRSHNETKDSLWAELIDEVWLGSKFHGMLRRVYKIKKAVATADCLNELTEKR